MNRTSADSIGRAGAVAFAGMGVLALVAPGVIPKMMGLSIANETGTNEVRAVYGGFGLAVAASLALGQPAHRAEARRFAGTSLLGMAGGRVLDAVLNQRLTRTAGAVMLGELALGSALRRG